MIYQADTLQVKEIQDGIAELSFCSPKSVNKLDLATLESLDKALDALTSHQGLKGLMLTSDKDAFIVGADITEFLGLFAKTDAELDQWLQFANSDPLRVASSGDHLGGRRREHRRKLDLPLW